MRGFRYLEGVSTLRIDAEACTGCGSCATVCPQRVIVIESGKARVRDLDACMECGACATNCAWQAITLHPGVGCADYILKSWISPSSEVCCGERVCDADC
jgi:ferredoxin